MKIVVCMKQVPATSKVDIDPETGAMKRMSGETRTNPYDLFALETALMIREKTGGTVTVLTMGPPQAEEMIRDAYTMGADEGVILSDRKFAGADVLATSYALAQGIQVIGGADLIICGRQTTDGDTAQVGPALYSAVLYFFFQLASVSVMYQHMEDVTDKKQINKAAIWMFVCNFCAMELSILGLLAIAYVKNLASASVPMLVLVQNGVGSGILTPIISLLIILGAISTAVNMISGIVTRCVNAVERRMDSPEKKSQGHLGRNAIFTAIFTFLAFAIAQFGLMTVVKKGYAYLGYAAFITLFVPFVVHAIATKGKEI